MAMAGSSKTNYRKKKMNKKRYGSENQPLYLQSGGDAVASRAVRS